MYQSNRARRRRRRRAFIKQVIAKRASTRERKLSKVMDDNYVGRKPAYGRRSERRGLPERSRQSGIAGLGEVSV